MERGDGALRFHWREGFHSPKGVNPDQAAAAIAKLPTPSPEALYEASKAKRHVLHEDLWNEGDAVWARRGRVDRCRHILGAVHEVVIVGNKQISIRAVEFVKTNGEGRWASLDAIRNDPELWDAYMAEVLRLQEQATAKMAKLRELMIPQAHDKAA
jgi:hypothetical protein